MNAKEILLGIERGNLLALTSTLTWDEVVWVVSKNLGNDEGINQGQKLLGFPNLLFVSADENVLVQAQSLMTKYQLISRDSIHKVSAITNRIKTIISDDKDIDQVKEIKRIPL
jgi:uncharacterized protein